MQRNQRGFTLVELMVVITIILAVSVVALPSIMSGMSERQIIGGSSQLQAAIVGARDLAMRTGSPAGIRLELDPSFPVTSPVDASQPIVANRWSAMATAPDHSEGLVSIHPAWPYPAWMLTPAGSAFTVPVLVLEEQPGHWVQAGGTWTFLMNSPVNWWRNVRIGEKLQINNAGPWYTVCGPVNLATAEGFLDATPPTGQVPFVRTYTAPDGITTADAAPQWMWLTNGLDDNHDGYVDSGFDGLDNDGFNGIDDPAEWESEAWAAIHQTGVDGVSYLIRRRPVPTPSEAVALPSGCVVDLTTGLSSRERSRLPVNPTTGSVVLMVAPDGRVSFDSPYGMPATIGLGSAWSHFWLTDRASIHTPVSDPALWNLLPDYGTGQVKIVSVNLQGKVSVNDPTAFDVAGVAGKAREPFMAIER